MPTTATLAPPVTSSQAKAGHHISSTRTRLPTILRPTAVPSGPAIDAIVKWFNVEKGFGFVELADGSGDAFLHAAVLEAAGHAMVDPGTKLSVQVGVGQKGRQVTAVLGLAASTGAAPHVNARSTGKAPSGPKRPDPATAISTEGTVKWFNADEATVP